MRVGIHVDLDGNFDPFLRRYEEILKFNNIQSIRLDVNDSGFWGETREINYFIFRWRHISDHHALAQTILPIIEYELNVPCFPNQKTCWHYDDKIRQYYILSAHQFPFIESWVFWNREAALKWAVDAELPVVFKLSKGAGSVNVALIESGGALVKIIKQMFSKGITHGKIPANNSLYLKKALLYRIAADCCKKLLCLVKKRKNLHWMKEKNYVLFQKYVRNNSYDTRVTVIGNRAFCFRRLVRDKDFRASGSGKIFFDKQLIDLRCVKIAFEVSKKLGFQSMAYDFLFNEKGNPEICEISYTYSDKAVQQCPGYWDADLCWHEGHYWPQYWHLVDLLQLPNLKCPKMEMALD